MQDFGIDVETRLLALVKSVLQQNAMTAEVGPQTLLVDIGLTSTDMVNLMMAVEAEFDFAIPHSEVTPENFRSVATLEKMITRQLQLSTV